VSRKIEPPAEKLFGLLAQSANHPLIDGSGMVREAPADVLLTRVGDVFVIRIAAWRPRPSGRAGNAALPPRK
jgi:hypothetical protein